DGEDARHDRRHRLRRVLAPGAARRHRPGAAPLGGRLEARRQRSHRRGRPLARDRRRATRLLPGVPRRRQRPRRRRQCRRGPRRAAVRAVAVAVLALALAAPAWGGRYAIGLERGASVDAVAARIEAQTGSPVTRLAPFALVANGRGAPSTPGVSFVEHLERDRVLAFTPNDPMLKRQWYVSATHAFDAWPTWPVRPTLGSVKVAIIDSGVDAFHPELADRIDDAQSFVPDSPNPLKDSIGHGTFVAGLIAAQLNNGTGIAGIGFPAHLLIAKVVRADGTISPEAEARAIRWAANSGARVINLSLAALRNPGDPSDEYSPLEAAAVQYAVSKGALVVAAVGNGEGATKLPWHWASYPAALPHVLGVSAVAQDGSVPDFSNGDPLYNDIAAPGVGILSTVPRDLSADRPTCQGYSNCGPDDFRHGD